jgi:lincosamide nucleotidyltransferase A/C/D/E
VTPADVGEILDRLAAAGVRCWVDGGWGVDALLGTTTRLHADLDLVVFTPDLARARFALPGFTRVLRDWLPAALALADDGGREVDLHPVTGAAGGGGEQLLPDGHRFRYPAPVPGVIGGRPVRCVDPHTQVLCHLGYPPGATDRLDVRRLCTRFGLAVPESYRAG